MFQSLPPFIFILLLFFFLYRCCKSDNYTLQVTVSNLCVSYQPRASFLGSPSFHQPMISAKQKEKETIVEVHHSKPSLFLYIFSYSDAQCPCSARVPQDVKVNFLDNAGFDGMVDFNQYFVGGTHARTHVRAKEKRY